MTLTDIIPAIHKLSVQEKIRVMRILAEDIDKETQELALPFEPGKVYDLPTPYQTFGAGKVLMDALETYDAKSAK